MSWASPGREDANGDRGRNVAAVNDVERLLRRLAVNDEESVGRAMTRGSGAVHETALRPKVDLLVELGALLALGASTSSLRTTVDRAIAAGATESEIVGVLL